MKKLMILVTLLMVLVTTGCSKTKDFQIEYEELSNEQSELLTLTGNKVLKYKLKNLPNDKNYELNLVYEVYKNNEKIKEELINGRRYWATNEKLEDFVLAMNIQENKIRFISGGYGYLDIEENIDGLSQQHFMKDTKINFGDEIYLFHGVKVKNDFKFSDLGLLSDEDKENYTKNNELNVFIKLVCEEK